MNTLLGCAASRVLASFALFCVVLGGVRAEARTIEPGTLTGTAGTGLVLKMPSRLGASGAYLGLDVGGEYAASRSWGVVGDVMLGASGTWPLLVRAGARYRLVDLELPVSPYVQGQVLVGKAWDVLGTNLGLWGVRGGVGADYFLTAKIGAGATVALDLMRTRGLRPAFFGLVEVLVYCSLAL